jgi:hypothetical protein
MRQFAKCARNIEKIKNGAYAPILSVPKKFEQIFKNLGVKPEFSKCSLKIYLTIRVLRIQFSKCDQKFLKKIKKLLLMQQFSK